MTNFLFYVLFWIKRYWFLGGAEGNLKENGWFSQSFQVLLLSNTFPRCVCVSNKCAMPYKRKLTQSNLLSLYFENPSGLHYRQIGLDFVWKDRTAVVSFSVQNYAGTCWGESQAVFRSILLYVLQLCSSKIFRSNLFFTSMAMCLLLL